MSRSGASAPTTARATSSRRLRHRRSPACGSVTASPSCVCGGYGAVAILVQPMPTEPTPLIASDDHLAHDGLVELVAGREVPCYESPERATAIRDALLATGAYALEAPRDHGPDPITAVHDLELLDLVEHVWADAIAAGRDPRRPLLPDTFLLRGYAGPMALEQLPARRHERLGAYCFDTATPIVAGTAAAARAAVDIALTAADRVLAGAPLAYGLCRPPGPSRRAQPHRRLLLLQQRGHRRAVARGSRRPASRDPGRRLPPRQRHAADLLGARRRALRQPPRRPRRRLSLLLRLRHRARCRCRRGRDPEPAACARGPMATPTWRPWTRGSTRSAPSSPMRRS